MSDITEEQLIQTLRNIVHERIVNTRGTEEDEIAKLVHAYCELSQEIRFSSFGRPSGLESGAALATDVQVGAPPA